MADQFYTRETWRQAYAELLEITGALGLPEEIGKVIAENLHSERSIRRMISYLKNAHPLSMEQIADEMIAIMEDRDAWIRKKQAQESSARYTAWLNSDQRGRDE